MNSTLLDDVVQLMSAVAAREVLPRWRNLGAGDVTEKTGPEDIVTIADQAAETALSAGLVALLPGSRVVGEEAVAADAGLRQALLGDGLVWVVDPIDGTSAFAAGEAEFAIMVALLRDRQLEAGFILAPALGSVIWGGTTYGVRQRQGPGDAAPLTRPAIPAHLQEMIGLLGRRNITAERRAELKAREHLFKALDGVTCAGVDYARLARGEAHFALYSKSEPWDHLPGLAILSALGFHYARHDGTPYRPGDNAGGLLVAPSLDALAAIRRALVDEA